MRSFLIVAVLVAICRFSVEGFNYNQLCDNGDNPNCPAGRTWTNWFNRDSQGGTGDWEVLSHLRPENPNQICDNPVAMEIQTTSGAPLSSTGDIVHYTLAGGFYCKNSEQSSYCQNYRVRFCC